MRQRSTLSRAVALAGLVLVPWGIMGFGRHDPGCPHHRLSTAGAPHLDHEALGRTGQRGGVSALAAPAAVEPGQGEGGGGSRDQHCHCFGGCVLGAHAVEPAVRVASNGLATLPQVRLPRGLHSAMAPTILVAGRLPPATGPPSRA